VNKVRLLYCKTGKAKYISHLDFMATMRRALLRAGLELKYSEGFNPHPYMSVALPLPVGNSSTCELMDIGIALDKLPDGLPNLINGFLPEGLNIMEVYNSERKFSNISWVQISGLLYYDAGELSDAVTGLTDIFSKESMVVSKKTKRGVSDIDIAPFIREVCFTNEGKRIEMSALISAQNPSISPENLMSVIQDGSETLVPDFYDFTRTAIFDKDMILFR